MTVSINGTNGLVFQDGTTQGTSGFTGFRNVIVNSNFDYWQRGTAVTSSTGYLADHWSLTISGAGVQASQQRTQDYPTVANGYCLEVKSTVTVSTVVELAARQYIEKQFMRHFVGKPVTASFWYKSNRTGTHGIRFAAQDAGGTNLDNWASFTVNTANTWEYKQVTFITCQTLTSWNMDVRPNYSGGFLDIGFKVGNGGPGFTSLALNDYFRLSRVQLEVGGVATDFEVKPPTVENDLCRRYYRRNSAGDSYSYVGQLAYFESSTTLQLPVDISGMRTNQVTAGISGALQCEQVGGSIVSIQGVGLRGSNFVRIQFTTTSAGTAGYATPIRTNNDVNAYLEINGELV